ncbi:MAG: ATP-binding protein [Anaerolineae bacterium]
MKSAMSKPEKPPGNQPAVKAIYHPRAHDDAHQHQSEPTTGPPVYQDLLSAVLANAPIALFALDRNGVFTFAEGRLLRKGEILDQLGLRLEDFPGRSVFELFSDRDLHEKFEAALAGTLLTSTDTLFGRSFDSRISQLRDNNGEVIGIIVVSFDITERMQAEEALRASEARYRALFDRVPLGLYRTTPDGRILDANPTLVEMLGCPDRATLLASNAASYYVSADVRRNVQQLLHRDGILRDFEMQLRRFDGKLIWVRDNARAVRDQDGRLLYYEGILSDISHWKQMERYIMRTERLAAMGYIATILAHEIKNPLQAIQSNLELVAEYPLSPQERKESLDTCCQEVEKLIEITQRVLGLARTEHETYRPFSIAQVVEDTLKLLSEPLRKADICVTTNLPADLPPVLGAPQQIGRVLLNLMINAIEAMSRGGRLDITAGLERGLKPGQEMLALTLTNDGPAIPTEYLERIFDPFFTTKPGGTGLGLFVSHNIVQQHGGTLRVGNLESDRGVAFTLTLPLATPAYQPTARNVTPGQEEHSS